MPAAEAPHRDSPGGSNGGREGRPSGELSKQRSLAPSSRLGSGVSELWTVDFRELDIQKEVGAGSFGKVGAPTLHIFSCLHEVGGLAGTCVGGGQEARGHQCQVKPCSFPSCCLSVPAGLPVVGPSFQLSALPTGALGTCAEERWRHPWSLTLLSLGACPCRPGCASPPCCSSPFHACQSAGLPGQVAGDDGCGQGARRAGGGNLLAG